MVHVDTTQGCNWNQVVQKKPTYGQFIIFSQVHKLRCMSFAFVCPLQKFTCFLLHICLSLTEITMQDFLVLKYPFTTINHICDGLYLGVVKGPQILPRHFKDQTQNKSDHISIHFWTKNYQGLIWILKKHLGHDPLPPLCISFGYQTKCHTVYVYLNKNSTHICTMIANSVITMAVSLLCLLSIISFGWWCHLIGKRLTSDSLN